MPVTEKRIYAEKWFSSDAQFNLLYPPSIQIHARWHWTPLGVARKATNFLAAENNLRILDIGSGVGKFCLSAAYYKPKAFFYGVEQRKNLVNHAETVREMLHIENVSFIPGNFTQLDFKNFDNFYFYNSFYENLVGSEKIDNRINYSVELYNYYNRYLLEQLDRKPRGTRLVTYHSLEDEIPKSYCEIDADFDNLLKFWIKI